MIEEINTERQPSDFAQSSSRRNSMNSVPPSPGSGSSPGINGTSAYQIWGNVDIMKRAGVKTDMKNGTFNWTIPIVNAVSGVPQIGAAIIQTSDPNLSHIVGIYPTGRAVITPIKLSDWIQNTKPTIIKKSDWERDTGSLSGTDVILFKSPFVVWKTAAYTGTGTLYIMAESGLTIQLFSYHLIIPPCKTLSSFNDISLCRLISMRK